MTLFTGQVTLTTTATLIYTNNTGDVDHIHVHAPSSGQPVYVGPAGVTTTTGFLITEGDRDLDILLVPRDSIYGVVAASTQVVSYIVVQ